MPQNNSKSSFEGWKDIGSAGTVYYVAQMREPNGDLYTRNHEQLSGHGGKFYSRVMEAYQFHGQPDIGRRDEPSL